MTWLDTWRGAPAAEAIGWALVHFIWPGAVIAIAAGLLMSLLRQRSANARYLVGCAAMGLMMLAPIVTAIIAWPSATGTGPSPAVGATVVASAPEGANGWFGATARGTLTVVWLVGVLLLQTRLALHWSNAQHLKRSGARRVPARWESMLEDLRDRIGVRASVRLVESTCVHVPMIIGWLRPVILVPTAAFTGLTPEQLRSILAHELSHVRRHDYIVNLVQAVCETLLFYHPAVWWLSRRIRVEREYCCDDLAVRVCGDPLCYAKALSSLDEMRGDDPCQPVLAATGGSLMDRIGRIAGVSTPRRIGGWVAPLVIAGSLTVTIGALAIGATVRDGAAPVRPIDQVDVMDIVRQFEPDELEMLAVLEETGVDNHALVMVLEELHARMRDRVEAGDLTEAEATERLEAAQQKAHAFMERQFNPPTPSAEQAERMVELRAFLQRAAIQTQLEREVAEGYFSEEEAAEHVAYAEHDIERQARKYEERARRMQVIEAELADEAEAVEGAEATEHKAGWYTKLKHNVHAHLDAMHRHMARLHGHDVGATDHGTAGHDRAAEESPEHDEDPADRPDA